MKALPILFFALMYHTLLPAQNTTAVTVRAGSKIMDVLTMADVFYYPQFMNGKVFFRDGTNADAKLNYQSLFDEMHFIGPGGDTLALAGEQTIKYVSILTDTFYYDQGYIRVFGGNNVVRLGDKQMWRIGDNRITGAYNTSNATSAVTSYTSYSAGGSRYGLVVNEDINLSKVSYYYLADNHNRFVVAGRKNVLMLFPKAHRQLELFLKENRVDFTNRKDLEKVAQFLGRL